MYLSGYCKLILHAQTLEITGSVYSVRPNKTTESFPKKASNLYTAIAVIFSYGSLKCNNYSTDAQTLKALGMDKVY